LGSQDTPYPFSLFGIECGPGWEKLYGPLIDWCQAAGVEIHQIKEKFGGLRFYVDYDISNEASDQISCIEQESFKVCEQCGEPGKPAPRPYWIKTLCEECAGARA
jgi:hypothetical protein